MRSCHNSKKIDANCCIFKVQQNIVFVVLIKSFIIILFYYRLPQLQLLHLSVSVTFFSLLLRFFTERQRERTRSKKVRDGHSRVDFAFVLLPDVKLTQCHTQTAGHCLSAVRGRWWRWRHPDVTLIIINLSLKHTEQNVKDEQRCVCNNVNIQKKVQRIALSYISSNCVVMAPKQVMQDPVE